MSNSGKVTLENSIKGDIDLELIGNSTQLTTTGKNLLNSSVYTQGYLASIDTGQKISLNTEAKSFTTSMDVSSMVGENISISVQTKEKTGKKYAFTDETDVIINGRFDAGRNTYSKFQNIQVPQNAKKLYFSVTYDVQENTELLVELGAKVTTYEPYTGGKPSPSPEYPQEIKNSGKWNEETQKYEVDVKVTGKNLFDQSKLISGFINMTTGAFEESANTSFANSLILDKPILLKSGQTLVTSVDNKYAQNFLRYRTYRKDGTFLINNEPISFSYKATEDLYVIALFYNGMSEEDKKSLQIEISDTSTTYEPYTEQTLTLTSDRPITKWDRLVEQGGQYGWLYASKKYVITGNEIFEPRSGYDQDAYTNRFIVVNDLFVNRLNDKQLAYCKILKRVQYIYAQNKLEEGIDTNINQLHIKLSNDRIGVLSSDDTETRTAKIAEYIKNTYTDGIEIMYMSSNSVFVPLPQSEQTQLRNLHSYIGTTNIMVDSGEVPCGIKVAYKQKK